ncbi:MAG: NAD-dependent epimerase/dehydratase family protein, partial [Ilumatobacteraceae bacterium]
MPIPESMPRRLLVTGAGGFVGANLVRRWATQGCEVVAAVRPGGDPWRLEGCDARVVEAELSDVNSLRTLLRDVDPGAVLHAAAHGAYSWQNDLESMLAVNVRAVSTIIDHCIEREVPFVQLGSSSEYGWVPGPPAETHRLSPNSDYAVTKAAASHLVEHAALRRGLRGVVARLYSVYGPWEDPRRLMPTVAWH